MEKKSTRPKNLEGMWNSLLQESKRLGLDIVIDKKIFLTNFKILNDKKSGDYFYNFFLDQLKKFKESLAENKDVPRCPKCDNLLFITGFTTLDSYSTFQYSCTSCGSSFEFDGYGFWTIPKKNELSEIPAPIFEQIRFCMG
jgi:DNA-directed RNA polymerase subunit RPC12/RpoP